MSTGKDKKEKQTTLPNQDVAATDYTSLKAASSGVPINAEWRNGKVSIGGILIGTESTSDGKAIVKSDSVNNAVKSLKDSLGLQSNQEIVKKYNDKYGTMYTNQLSKIKDREEFEYKAENDPVYKSYKTQYNREGTRATEDAVGVYSALTGGMGNSSAVTAAAQSGQYWNDKLMDVIPQLAGDAYDRYVKEFEMDRLALQDILSVDKYLFDREYGANRDTMDDIRSSQKYAYDRDQDAQDRNYEAEKDKADIDYKTNKDTLDRQADHDQWTTELTAETRQKEWENALKLYDSVGEIPNEYVAQILGVPAGTVTSEMKQMIEKLAQERLMAQEKYSQEEKMAGIDYGYDSAIESQRHKNDLAEINQRKK